MTICNQCQEAVPYRKIYVSIIIEHYLAATGFFPLFILSYIVCLKNKSCHSVNFFSDTNMEI